MIGADRAGGVGGGASMNDAPEREECFPLNPGRLLLRKLALSLVLKTRQAEFASLIPLEAATQRRSESSVASAEASRKQPPDESALLHHHGRVCISKEPPCKKEKKCKRRLFEIEGAWLSVRVAALSHWSTAADDQWIS